MYINGQKARCIKESSIMASLRRNRGYSYLTNLPVEYHVNKALYTTSLPSFSNGQSATLQLLAVKTVKRMTDRDWSQLT